MNSRDKHINLTRRDFIKWFAAVAVVSEAELLNSPLLRAAGPVAKGYGTDPLMNAIYKPGDFWPMMLSDTERKTVTALADVIIPADELGPAASAVRVPDFINEWVSAPYPDQEEDRDIIVPGLRWLNKESKRRFKINFANLNDRQQHAICDVLCQADHTKETLITAAEFFHNFTELCMQAYYATPEGWKAIGYVGNKTSVTFDGPPKAVLDKLGLEQTVKD